MSVAARSGPVMTAVNGTLVAGRQGRRCSHLTATASNSAGGCGPSAVTHASLTSREAARPSGSCGISPPVNLVLISRHLQVCRLPSKQPIVR
jgi:hypothetical protein